MVAFANAFLEEIIEGNLVINLMWIDITDRGKNICRIAVALRPFGECLTLIVVFQEIILDNFPSPLMIAVARLRAIMRFSQHKNLVPCARIILTHVWVKVDVLRGSKSIIIYNNRHKNHIKKNQAALKKSASVL